MSQKRKSTTDGGYYAVKGFAYQMDKAILELFDAIDDDVKIGVEQIQDINSDSFVIQIKYRETQEYKPSKIRKAIIQLLEEFANDSNVRYYLYCHFQDKRAESKVLSLSELDIILGKEKLNFDTEVKMNFLSKFYLVFSPDFQHQFDDVLSKIGSGFQCNKDEAIIYYGIIADLFQKAVITNPPSRSSHRLISRGQVKHRIAYSKEIIFKSAYQDFLGKDKYFRVIKKRHFTYSNIDDIERFIIIELNSHDSFVDIYSIILQLKSKFFKISRRAPSGRKSGAPYIFLRNIDTHELKRLKSELLIAGNTIRDGYDFKDADFNLITIMERSTNSNNICLKFISEQDVLNDIINNIHYSDKIVYQFYRNSSIIVDEDVKTINIHISSLEDIDTIIH